MTDQGLFTFIALSILLMTLLAVAVIVIFNISQKRIMQQINSAHEAEISYQKQLLNTSIETQEKERSRIAKDLHDEIGSKLNVINLSLSLLESKVSDRPDLQELMQQINGSLMTSIQRTREISQELLPPTLTKFGLSTAIHSLADQINKTRALSISATLIEDVVIPKDKEVQIYRIVQELLSNTIKHAQATNVTIETSVADQQLTLHYADDGKGLAKKNQSRGIGMDNLRARADILGGGLEIKSEPGQGFKATLAMPLTITP